MFRYSHLLFCTIVVAHTLVASGAHAHSVAQRDVTTFLAPETIQLLKDRASGVLPGGPGLRDGDIFHVLQQSIPVPNNAQVGASAVVTMYPSAGTEVVGADIVALSGGRFVPVAPRRAGIAADGFGGRGQNHNWEGSLAAVYADTGIFYSTDARTAFNGGVVPSPGQSGAGALLAILGTSMAFVYNDWDRDMVQAYGATRGHTPFGYGSAVAGPETYYQNDYRFIGGDPTMQYANGDVAAQGPWNRIAYTGSETGTGGPKMGAGIETRVGVPTALGRTVSPANPLPANTTAVRYSLGERILGVAEIVKISLRVTDIDLFDANDCTSIIGEVYGGDAAAEDECKDSIWRYAVPALTRASTCQYIKKTGPLTVETGEQITYDLEWANVSAGPLTNVVITDIIDTANVTFVSAVPAPDVVNPGDIQWLFPTLTPGQSGSFQVTVDVTGGDDFTPNVATLDSDELDLDKSTWVTLIGYPPSPAFKCSKSVSPSGVEPGDTVTYTIVFENDGYGPTTMGQAITITDNLPAGFTYTAGTADVTVGPNCTFSAMNLTNNGSATSPSWDVNTELCAGDSIVLTFDATVDLGTGSGTYFNEFVVNVVTDTRGSLTETCSMQAPVVVGAPTFGDSTLTATDVNGGDLIPGEVVCWELDVMNTAPQADATGVVAILPVPTATTLDVSTVTAAGATISYSSTGVSGPFTYMAGPGLDGNVTHMRFAWPAIASQDSRLANFCTELDTGLPDCFYTWTQAQITSDQSGMFEFPSDDPSTVQGDDPTGVKVVARPDLTTSVKQANISEGSEGDTVTYTVTVTNTGGGPATNTIVTDVVDTMSLGNIALGVFPVGVEGAFVTPTITWVISSIEAGSSVDLTFTGEILPTASNPFLNRACMVTDNEPGQFCTPNVSVNLSPKIGDLVWIDSDQNGVQDAGEAGIPGVTLNLRGAGPDGMFLTGDDIIASTVTDANGFYEFASLTAGDYVVDVDDTTLPAGLALAAGVDPLPVALASGQSFQEADFGYIGTASIGDLVFADLDSSGSHTVGDTGIPGVTVELILAGTDGIFGTMDDLVFTQVTDSQGAYDFQNLPAGNYRVDVMDMTLPPAAVLSSGTDPLTLVLAAGQDFDDADFGYDGVSASIGDEVYIDSDGDGMRDPGEPGLPGVTIELTWFGPDGMSGGGDDVVYSTVSDAMGMYSFMLLPPGEFVVDIDETTAPGLGLTTGDMLAVTLIAGQNDNSADFGFNGTNSLGDTVFFDVNADSVDDPADPGIAMVAVSLTWAGVDLMLGTADDVVFTQLTDINGNYFFVGLPDGDFLVDVNEGTAGAGTTLTTANDPLPVSLSAAQSFLDADFGFTGTGAIGDLVYIDLNGDEVRDPGEAGLPGVTVTLTYFGPDGMVGGGDDIVTMVVSNGSGIYRFPNLPGGEFSVDVDTSSAPMGSLLTTGNDPTAVTLSPGELREDVDFGFDVPFSPSDLSIDKSSNAAGIVRPGDTITYTVLVTNNGGVPQTGFALSDVVPAGTSFVPGSASAMVPVPPIAGHYRDDFAVQNFCANNGALSFSTCWSEDGTDDNDAGGGQIKINGGKLEMKDPQGSERRFRRTMDLANATTADLSYDYEQQKGTGGTLFVEASTDGGVSFSVLRAIDLDNTQDQTFTDDLVPFATASTMVQFRRDNVGDRESKHEFMDIDVVVPPIQVITPNDPALFIDPIDGIAIPAGATVTLTFDVTVNSPRDLGQTHIENTASTFSVENPIPQSDLVRDPLPTMIGDFVWRDLNGDGIQDPGEPGIATVIIELLSAGPDGVFGTPDDTVVATDITDGLGLYRFDDIPAGDYRLNVVESTLPLNFGITSANEPDDFNLPDGAVYLTGDFGYRLDSQTAGIGDFVWHDDDGDGIQDMGEVGIPGVMLDLVSPGPDGLFGTPDDVTVDSATTDAGGLYSFTGLPAGTYRVVVDAMSLPPGFVPTSFSSPPTVTVVVGQIRDDVDFGFDDTDPGTASIGDLIWADADGNGLLGQSEVGIASVTVRLRSPGNDGIFGTGDDVTEATAVTSGAGAYNFSGLDAGTYLVDVDESTLPVGVALTTANEPLVVSVIAGEDFDDADFGYDTESSTGAIGDLVWSDRDGDGFRDPGEAGLAGITLNLTSAGPDGILGTVDDAVIASTMTDASGAYSFPGLDAGLYSVDVDDGTVPAGLTLTSSGDPLVVSLGIGEVVDDADFGYRDPGTASIGDVVFNDADGSGSEDPGEPGIPGVTIRLLGAGPDGMLGTTDDVTLATTTTDASGAYFFSGLDSGEYRVEVDDSTIPVGLASSTGNNPTDVTLLAAQARLDVDFGYEPESSTSSIGDFIWDDVDRNMAFDGLDVPLAGVLVNLVQAGADGVFGTGDDVMVASDTTDAAGAYGFAGLAAGLYLVAVDESTLPGGYTLTTANEPLVVSLAVDTAFDTADFGYADDPDAGSIGDLVWNDADGNGVQNGGELGYAGVTLELFTPGADGILATGDDVSLGTTSTNGSGIYSFTGLAAGDYRVEVDETSLPGAPGITTVSNPILLGLATNEARTDVDFGYRTDDSTGVIGDLVWNDSDGNGLYDPGEEGQAGVIVNLFGPGVDGVFGGGDDVLVATTTTDAVGAYTFSGLDAGIYRVDVDETTLPSGWVLSTGNEPMTVSIAVGESFLAADFGYRDPLTGSISDLVWNDQNGNGSQDFGESGIQNVILNLFTAGGDGVLGTADDVLQASTTTDPNGNYIFGSLPAGQYRVDVDDTTVSQLLGITTGNDATNLSLAAGQAVDTVDFGYRADPGNGTLGDLVWRDINASMALEFGEIGLSGVTVELLQAGADGLLGTADDVVVSMTTTDGSGAYDFTGLDAGNYLVRVDETTLPSVMVPTVSTPIIVQLSVSQNFDDADFGYRADPSTGNIGDLVWNDLDGNGLKEISESGIPSVTVMLIGAGADGLLGTIDDTLVGAVVTDADGAYDFTGLDAGNYRVDVDETTLPVGLGLTTGNEPRDVALVSGQDFEDADFGYRADAETGTVGDLVFHDLDSDGFRDPGEPGLQGVLVRLVGPGADNLFGTSDDLVHGVTPTNANGLYIFLELAADRYRVEVDASTLPNGLVLTTNNEPIDLSLAVAEDFLDADFGYGDPMLASIGDTVFLDTNGDGLEDPGESGIANVMLELFRDGLSTGLTTVSGANGGYVFDSLPAGSYSVVVTASNFNPGGALEGRASTTGGESHGPISMLIGTDYNAADFGYQPTTFTIGDFVWSDASNDGVQDPGEVGVAGVMLDLFVQGMPLPVASTVTDATGHYEFDGLAPAVYLVEVVPGNFDPAAALDGYTVTTGPQSIGNDLSGGFGVDVTRPLVDTVDFGYFSAALGSIGDLVYLDADLDGTPDVGESGIGGVSINLVLDANGNGIADPGELVAATATTDPSGAYLFGGLTGGDYVVEVTDTAGSLAGLPLTSSNEPLAVALMAGQNVTDADFGYGGAGIGDYVWLDTNADGIQDGSEGGMAGVEVWLYDDLDGNGLIDPEDSVRSTTTTAGDGSYLFGGIPDGNYIVSIPSFEFGMGGPLAGMLPSPAGQGGDAALDSNGVLDGAGSSNSAVALAGGIDLGVDFAMNAASALSIGDYLWLDVDGDGMQDVGEAGIDGVTIELYRDLDDNGVIDPSDLAMGVAITSGGGLYSFGGLPEGDYILVITDEANLLAGKVQTSGERVTTVANLTMSRDDIDFGFFDDRPLIAIVSDLRAEHDGSETVVSWRTISEIETAGFYLQRQDTPGGVWNLVQPTLIPSRGTTIEGASYFMVDSGAFPGSEYSYRLEEVETAGTKRLHGPYLVQVTVGVKSHRAGLRSGRKASTPAAAAKARARTHLLERHLYEQAAANNTGLTCKIEISTPGLTTISAAGLAAKMGFDEATAKELILGHELNLTTGGEQVPYIAATDGEALYFYGSPADENDLYNTSRIYILEPGQGLAPRAAGPIGAEKGGSVSWFIASKHHEESKYWRAKSDNRADPLLDYWFWDVLYAGFPGFDSRVFALDAPGIDAGSVEDANLVVRLLGVGPGPHHAQVKIGGLIVGETSWTGELVHEYGCSFSATMLSEEGTEVTIHGVLDHPGYDILYVDSFDVGYPVQARAIDGALLVENVSRGLAISVDGFVDGDIVVLETGSGHSSRILDDASIRQVRGEFQVTFHSRGDQRSYSVTELGSAIAPSRMWADTPSTLRSASNSADYLVVTAGELAAPAQRLADYRQSQGHRSMVVYLEDIMDEFAHGMLDPAAIGRLVEYAHENWKLAPRYVVLAGDGHYDYKDYLGRGGNVLPPLMIPTSEGLYPSDQRLVSAASGSAAHTVVGRLPAITSDELGALVDKIIAYEANSATGWETKAIFAADNADGSADFASDSDALAEILPPTYQTERIYLDQLPADVARQRLIGKLEAGASILNYNGHGGLTQLAAEGLLRQSDVAGLAPSSSIPVVIGSSCLLGHHAVPGFPSIGETLVTRADGGAIAAFLPSGLTIAAQGRLLNGAVLSALEGGKLLGDVVRNATEYARETTVLPSSIDTMILLGDPALRLKR